MNLEVKSDFFSIIMALVDSFSSFILAKPLTQSLIHCITGFLYLMLISEFHLCFSHAEIAFFPLLVFSHLNKFL